MTSVSEVDWKMQPRETRSPRSESALVRLPLCAMLSPPQGEIGEERLDVAHLGRALGGIAVVADRRVALQRVDHLARGEDVTDPAERPVRVEDRAVGADDSGRFLAPVLQRVQAERRVGRRVGVPEDAKDPALLAQLVVVGRHARGCNARPGCHRHSTLSLRPSSWFRSRSL